MARSVRPSKAAALGSLPTAAGGITRAAHARAIQAGLDTELLLKRAGLTARQVADRNSRIVVKDQIRFLNFVADALKDEFLGIHLAQCVDLRELGLLYYVQASSAHLGDALKRAARYSSIHNEGVRLDFCLLKSATLSFEYVGVRRTDDRHQIEFFAALAVRLCRQLAGRQLLPICVRFLHRRNEIPSDVRAFFGCPIVFDTGIDEIVYPASAASSPVVGADTYLNSLLTEYCEQAIAGRRRNSNAWQVRVENAIAPLLPHGQAQMSEVCSKLGVSQRTLVRRLASEQLTFSGVLHDLRVDLARRYLQEPDLPVSQIAWLLGYRDASAFNHAFKRWTGETPSHARSSRPTLFTHRLQIET
jgi:AraC-like DNA-binding protein